MHFLFETRDEGDEIARCLCGYRAPWASAVFRDPAAEAEPTAGAEVPGPRVRVATPGCTTIDQLCAFLHVPASKIAKAVMLSARLSGRQEGSFVLAVVRGDRELSEAKLGAVLGAGSLRRPPKRRSVARVPCRVRFRHRALPESDRSDRPDRRPIGEPRGRRQRGGLSPRERKRGEGFPPGLTSDIAMVREGDPCPRCGKPLDRGQAVILGSLQALRVADAAAPHYQNREGRESQARLLRGGLDLGRLLECIAEAHNDEHGLLWPAAIAPFDVELISLGSAGTEVFDETLRLSERLAAAGIDVLFDDREERAGVKFADADLVGAPLRVTVSTRGLESGSVEMKLRSQAEKRAIPRTDAAALIMETIAALRGRA